MSFFIDGHKDGCFHGVIDNVFVGSFDFFNGILVSSRLFVGDWIKDDVSIFIVGFGIDEGTVSGFQLEGKFTVFKVTACQFFRQFKSDASWCCDVFTTRVSFTVNECNTRVIAL